jgi:hypothetical protein
MEPGDDGGAASLSATAISFFTLSKNVTNPFS